MRSKTKGAFGKNGRQGTAQREAIEWLRRMNAWRPKTYSVTPGMKWNLVEEALRPFYKKKGTK